MGGGFILHVRFAENEPGGTGCLTGGLDNPTPVILRLQHVQPACEISGGLLMPVLHNVRFHADKRCRHFRHQFLLRINLPAEAIVLRERVAVQSSGMSRRMCQLMKEHLAWARTGRASDAAASSRYTIAEHHWTEFND